MKKIISRCQALQTSLSLFGAGFTLGNEGKLEVEKLLKSLDKSFRLVAFRALRGASVDVVPLCEKMVNDPNSAVRREVAIALRDVPFEKCKDLINRLISNYDVNDAWALNAIGTASDRKQTQVYELFKQSNPSSEKLNKIAWELHPVNAFADLKNTLNSPTISEKTQNMALKALGFMKDKSAVETMIALTKSPKKELADKARWNVA
jgi:HEAT repeat protein